METYGLSFGMFRKPSSKQDKDNTDTCAREGTQSSKSSKGNLRQNR